MDAANSKFLGMKAIVGLGTAICLLAACGGLTKYTEEAPPAYSDDTADYSVLTFDECATLCVAALATVSALLGCETACGVSVSADYDASAVLITPLFGVWGAVEVDGGGICELVQDCPEQTECTLFYGQCLDNAATTDEIAYCAEEYQECRTYSQCAVANDQCLGAAQQILNVCLDAGTPVDECQATYAAAATTCACLYRSCLDRSVGSECVQAQPVSAKVEPMGPGRWRVPRPLIDEQLDRLEGLDREVLLIPTRNRQGRLVGVVLPKISEHDVLYSLGLRSGDLLISVGGLSPFEKDFGKFRRLYDQKVIRVEIRRDGERKRMTYELVGPSRRS